MRAPILFAALAAAGASAAIAGTITRRRHRTPTAARVGPDACAARHAGKVGRIAAWLKSRVHTEPISIRKRAVSHEVPKANDKRRSDEKIDVRALDEIIAIDPVRRTCVAESGVTFVDLVSATMKHGLVPLVVPELETITIGGAVSGCSLESSSFRFGGFHDTCLAYEVVTARGDVLACKKGGENRLLFEMMHGSFGTLGVLTKLEMMLAPARPFVKVTYEKHRTVRDYLAAIARHAAERDVDFLDGMIHSPIEYVLAIGRFVDDAPYTNRYDWTKVYWQSTRERREDYLRTRDYFFRYDHGVTNVHPRSAIGRLFFGKLLGSTALLKLAARGHRFLRSEQPTVIVDTLVPLSRAAEFIAWYTCEIGFFPVWCVPYRRVRAYEWMSDELVARTNDELFVDLAIYGLRQPGHANYHALLERKLLEIGGIKTLISHNYYSERDFWRVWNKRNYDRVKAVTDPENVLRDLYTKTCRASRGL
jgi:hypothetical protein